MLRVSVRSRAVSLGAVIVFLVSACNGGATSAPPASAPTAGASSTAASTSTPASSSAVGGICAAGQPQVSLAQMRLDENPFWDSLIARFQAQNPCVTVQSEVVNGPDFLTKFNAYVAAGSGPDMVAMQAGKYWFPYAKVFQPLTSDLGSLMSTVNGPEAYCLNYDCTKDVYGIPYNVQGNPIYFNKTVLTAAGLDPNNPPTTFSQMNDACKKIVAIGKYCWAFGAKNMVLDIWFGLCQETLSTNDYLMLGAKTEKFTDPPFVHCLQVYQAMIQNGWFPPTAIAMAGSAQPEAEAQFTTGKAAFNYGAVSEIANFKVYGTDIGPANLGVLPHLPAIEKDNPLPGVGPGEFANVYSIVAATAFMIPTWVKPANKAAALAFIEFMNTPETAADYLNTGSFPALKAAAYKVPASIASLPIVAQVQAMVAAAADAKAFHLYFVVGDTPTSAAVAPLQQMFLGKMTAEQAAQVIQAAVDAAP